MAKLTVKKLESLTPADIGTRLPDAQALYGVVKAKGSGVAVMFRWRYRFGGKLHDFGCGTWPSKTLKEIRDAHDGARQLLAQGKDPNGERRVARLHAGAANAEAIAHAKSRMAQVQALQARLTVDALFERWLAVDLIRRKDGGKEIRRMFQKDVLPLLGALAVEDVRKGHIIAVIDALLARQVPRMAKLVFSLVRQMFRFAVDRDIIEHEPTAAIRKARIGGKPTERERVLSEAEIRALYRQLPLARLSPVSEAALWLALATGCRIGEILRAEWQHVHLAASEWFIPAVNSKNGRPHTIFLSDFAARQFVLLKSINGSVAWCFPNRDASAYVNVKAITKQVGDRQRGAIAPMAHRSQATNGLVLPGGKWTPHDLRRTGATLMTAMGVLPEVAEKCLNHTEESRVKRTYQRYSYETEKREAWRLLGERLDQLTLGSDNVVMLNRTRGA